MDKDGLFTVALFDGDDDITDHIELAREALADTTGTRRGELDIESDGIGGWNAQLPAEMAEQLKTNGWFGIENPRFRLEAEWVD